MIKAQYLDPSKDRERYFDSIMPSLSDKDLRYEALRRLEKSAGIPLVLSFTQRSGDNLFDIILAPPAQKPASFS